MLRKLFGQDRSAEAARECYTAIVQQARVPDFYLHHGVPDTLDGRFDLLVLHVSLVLIRLSRDKDESEEFSQALFDTLFADMDGSLREIGVSDISIGKKVKQMGKAFYGRLEAYREALATAPEQRAEALSNALFRNLYRGEEQALPNAEKMAAYVVRQAAHLANVPTSDILASRPGFVAP